MYNACILHPTPCVLVDLIFIKNDRRVDRSLPIPRLYLSLLRVRWYTCRVTGCINIVLVVTDFNFVVGRPLARATTPQLYEMTINPHLLQPAIFPLT